MDAIAVDEACFIPQMENARRQIVENRENGIDTDSTSEFTSF